MLQQLRNARLVVGIWTGQQNQQRAKREWEKGGESEIYNLR